MKKFIMGMTAAMVALGLSLTAAPANSATIYPPTLNVYDANTTMPAGYTCKGIGYNYSGGQNNTPPFTLHQTSPSGVTTETKFSDELPVYVCPNTELGTWTAWITVDINGATSNVDTYVVSAGASTPAPAPTPVATGGSTASSNDKCATRKEFKRVKRGMTLTKVKRIVGSKGRLTVSSSWLKIRQWDNCSNPYGVMTIGFRNGRVDNKSFI